MLDKSLFYLKQALSSLDIARCEDLLLTKCHEENKDYPIFVCICQQKVIWKNLCERWMIDMNLKWSKESLRKHLLQHRSEKQFLDNEVSESCLEKVLVDGVFEQFVSLFVEFGYDINATDVSGLAALHYAIKHGLLATAEALIDAGACVMKEAKITSWIHPKLPALYHSLFHMDVEMTKLLINKASDKPLLKHQLLIGIDDFVFLPRRTPLVVAKCLRKIDKIDTLIFVLIVSVVKCFSCPSSLPAEKIISNCLSLRNVLSQCHLCDYTCPKSLLELHRSFSVVERRQEEVQRKMGASSYEERLLLELIKTLLDPDATSS